MIKAYFLMGIENLDSAMQIRKKVFVDEQGFSEENEQDSFDSQALHVIVEDGAPCGTGRLYFDGKTWCIGRVAVLKEKRGQHLGDLVMRMLLNQALQMKLDNLYVGAQKQAAAFYEKYGFEPCGEEYLDEHCPHVPMCASMQKVESMVFSGCGGDCANCGKGCAQE